MPKDRAIASSKSDVSIYAHMTEILTRPKIADRQTAFQLYIVNYTIDTIDLDYVRTY